MAMPTTIVWPVDAAPDVRVAGLFPLQARAFDHVYRTRAHALHLHEYAGTIRIAGQDHALAPGTLTLSPADVESSYDLPRAGVHWCVHFMPVLMPATRGRGPNVRLPLARAMGTIQGEAMKRFAHVARLHAARVSASGARRSLLGAATSLALQELLVWASLLDDAAVAGPAGRTIGHSQDVIERLVEFIDRNLGRPIRAESLATRAGLSQNYLARLFRERTGTTLPRYVATRRIGLARLLLDTTDLPVKQVALRVGVADPHHFNKQFRAIVGTSPTAYRLRGTLG